MNHVAVPWLLSIIAPSVAAGQMAPVADHHQHLFSPAMAALDTTHTMRPLTARDVIALLDSAGIRQAVLQSVAYIYGSPARTVGDEYAKVRAENDWNRAQAAEYPKRLRAFCGFNRWRRMPSRSWHGAPGIRDCAAASNSTSATPTCSWENPAHIEQLRRVFRAANENRMAIVVHLRASISKKRPYGPVQARAFLEQLLPAAPDVTVQVAHLAGTGPGYDDPPADSVMGVLAHAVETGDPRTRRLLFDIATVVDRGISAANAARVVKRIRQVGVERILYGSDAAAGDNLRPRESWAAFRRLPLTEGEFRTIARNVAPYLR
jgi:uncharacterized protein